MRFVAFLSFLLFPLITVARPQVSAEGHAGLDCHSSNTSGICGAVARKRPRQQNCTGFCTDCLHPVLTMRYWPLGGGRWKHLRRKVKAL